jgi:cytochrome oxidase Cu insertion factor (SCO1/SenC/PrrC family)
MDHTAYVMLFDRTGDFVETIGYQEPIEQALPKLIRLLD